MEDTLGEVRTNSLVTFSYKRLHTDMEVLTGQQELIDNSSVRTKDVVSKICRKRWMVGTNEERERERERERESQGNPY